jgi:hypothetical protein
MIPMEGIGRWLRSNWDAVAATLAVFAAIAIILGPAWFFLTWYFGGCGYIVYQCLKR